MADPRPAYNAPVYAAGLEESLVLEELQVLGYAGGAMQSDSQLAHLARLLVIAAFLVLWDGLADGYEVVVSAEEVLVAGEEVKLDGARGLGTTGVLGVQPHPGAQRGPSSLENASCQRLQTGLHVFKQESRKNRERTSIGD